MSWGFRIPGGSDCELADAHGCWRPHVVLRRVLAHDRGIRGRGALALVARRGRTALVARFLPAPGTGSGIRGRPLRPLPRPPASGRPGAPGEPGPDPPGRGRAGGARPADPAERRSAHPVGCVGAARLAGGTGRSPSAASPSTSPTASGSGSCRRPSSAGARALYLTSYTTTYTLGHDLVHRFPDEVAQVHGLALEEIQVDPFLMVVPEERTALRDRRLGEARPPPAFPGDRARAPRQRRGVAVPPRRSARLERGRRRPRLDRHVYQTVHESGAPVHGRPRPRGCGRCGAASNRRCAAVTCGPPAACSTGR